MHAEAMQQLQLLVWCFFRLGELLPKSASTYEGAINSAWEGFVVDKLKA